MHHNRVEWKSTQASLVIIPASCHSLSNTTREHSLNTPAKASDFNFGMSSHHHNTVIQTSQLKVALPESGKVIIHRTVHFNHFQTVNILNLTHSIVIERVTTNSQFSQSLTILQMEFTIGVLFPSILIQLVCLATQKTYFSILVV